MRRVVLMGGGGFFGGAVTRELLTRRIEVVAPTRQQADAENPGSLRQVLRRDDVVVDAAGPFEHRTTTLLGAALELGCDVIDLSDSQEHAGRVLARETDVSAAGIVVMPACSAVSTLSAVLVATTRIPDPVRVSVCLVPASRVSATAATGASLLRCVGAAVTVLRDGRPVRLTGFGEARPFQVGPRRRRAWLAESSDALLLPRSWPTLRGVDFWVDTNLPGLNRTLAIAALVPGHGPLLGASAGVGARLARWLGSAAGGFAVEVEAADGRRRTASLTSPAASYLCAVLPAVLAAEQLARARPRAGVIANHLQVPAERLLGELQRAGLQLTLTN